MDYVDQYNRNVLGIREVNWGMIGLVALIVVVVLGGAGFAAMKKGWLVVTFEKPVKKEASLKKSQNPPKSRRHNGSNHVNHLPT